MPIHTYVPLKSPGIPPSRTLFKTLNLANEIIGSTPIIVLTGIENESLSLNAVRSGAQDYLIKDEINPTLLMRAITYAIERVRMSSHLRQARDERHVLDAAISQLGQGIILADAMKPGMPITFANDAFLVITGYEQSEVLGRNCRFLQGQGTDAATVKQISEALDRHEGLSIEILNYRKDGSPFWNYLTLSPVFSKDGQLTHYVGLQTDITERRRQAERLWLLEAAIEQANESVTISTRLDNRGPAEVVYANRAFNALSGYEPEEIDGRAGVVLPGPAADPVISGRDHGDQRQFHSVCVEFRQRIMHTCLRYSPVDMTGRGNNGCHHAGAE